MGINGVMHVHTLREGVQKRPAVHASSIEASGMQLSMLA